MSQNELAIVVGVSLVSLCSVGTYFLYQAVYPYLLKRDSTVYKYNGKYYKKNDGGDRDNEET